MPPRLALLVWAVAGSLTPWSALAQHPSHSPPPAPAPLAPAFLAPAHHHAPASSSAPPQAAALPAPGPAELWPPPKADEARARWRQANAQVAGFERGHADWLRWEQVHGAAPAAAPRAPEQPLDLAQALTLASRDWPQIRLEPGMSPVQTLQQSQALARQRLQVAQAWIDAVASAQLWRYREQALDAAEAGAELARRMAHLGHFSRQQALQHIGPELGARVRRDEARASAQAAIERLWVWLGRDLSPAQLAQRLPLHLPTQWPAPPEMDEQALLQRHPSWAQYQAQLRAEGVPAERLAALDARWQAQLSQSAGALPPPLTPGQWGGNSRDLHAWQTLTERERLRRQVVSDWRQARAAYTQAVDAASRSWRDIVQAQTTLEEEQLLRYNGMLSSVWDLLASVRDRVQAVESALAAQRQAWRAHAELLAVQAGLPYTGTNPSIEIEPNAKGGH